jgi:hypothetical protein
VRHDRLLRRGPVRPRRRLDLDGRPARRILARVFDAALADWTQRTGESQAPFSEADYLAHVDGKPRHDGVRDFLTARGVEADVDAIADRKQALVERALDEGGRGPGAGGRPSRRAPAPAVGRAGVL